jgi:cytochrome c oxidase subunit 1/cytochrome c oxidase subunit I+III
MLATLPFDWQVSDSYFVVAHFHYVAIGGIVFAIMAGLHYWMPKFSGKMMFDGVGKVEFWLLVIGFNTTFGIQHFLGFFGMARRTYTYADFPHYAWMNLLSTIGAFIIAAAVALFAVNLVLTLWKGKRASNNPWGAYTLEWLTTSPPPHYNFKKVPLIRGRRPVWDLDHPELADEKQEKTPEDNGKRGNRLKMSVSLLITTESVMFFLLLAGHVLYQESYDGPPVADILDIPRTWIFSVVLWSSSIALILSEKALRRGAKGQFLSWLGLTICMGIAFIVGTVLEYTGLLSGGFDMQTNQFGATFYMITGLHCIHVCIGLIVLSIMWFLGTRSSGGLNKKRESRMTSAGYYWHFVDIVWIFVFFIIYYEVLN